MTDRRRFIQTLAAAPLCWAMAPALAAPDPARVALVIGNAAYPRSPLLNPTHDAEAMQTLFASAGFTTDHLLNARRADMLAAIDRFVAAIEKPGTRQAVFYYAGHGVQLDWRNYLLPVDIAVQASEDIKRQCVDLGHLLGRLSKGQDKTFIVILDACRDDPFRGAYTPTHKGLSQFDAPAGSLLAYATAPGSVAADGTGQHGLYTEHLVREFSNRQAKIEDALKRVRLGVRLGSDGAQIPWETTSLESDVFLFPDGDKKLSEAELERQIEAEIALWTELKDSKKVDDWVAYLRQYPNGRFAEIAQARLGRLLAAAKSSPAAMPSPTPATAASTPLSGAASAPAPALILQADQGMTLQVQASGNPNSAGRYPLGRKFSLGDTAEYRHTDLLTGVVESTSRRRVTRVDEDNDRVELNDGGWILDLMGNLVRHPRFGEMDVPQQINPVELQIGYKWTAAWKQRHPKFGQQVVELALKISQFEPVSVPAGRFQAFRIEGRGWVMNQGVEIRDTYWVVPGFNFPVKSEHTRRRQGRLVRTERIELVSATQMTLGEVCTTTTGLGKTRNLMIHDQCGG
ncbi:MAG: caspase family protein [Pseudomonadota bacterium]